MKPMDNLPTKTNGAAPPATLIDMVRSMQAQIALAITGHTPQERIRRADRFARIVVTALQKDPNLRQCSKESFIGAMMTCAQLDLEPNTPQQLAHLIPYRNKGKLECQFQPGYPGLMELAYRTGKVSAFHADVVYKTELEKGLFKYSKGLNPNIEHEVDLLSNGREGELVAAYAVAAMKDGTRVFRVVTKADIARAKNKSAGAGSSYSPWNTSPEAMWMKTAIKRLCAFLPRTEQLAQAVELDDQAERGEAQAWFNPDDEQKDLAEDLNAALSANDEALEGDFEPAAEEGETQPISPATLQAVEKELTRLGVPGQLPPDIVSEYDTGDPSELTEAQGRQALDYLKGMK